ncbi:unnamed protein product [Nesidiocoris tenuis]|uniref:Uncharacterized protein n=1 Tax=Nesidiocoris tenuis TaxID=355587 RepID=A0A6H5H6L4_9HEMI|nr:unnamed protein product [Nesidiocoris tenuis]
MKSDWLPVLRSQSWLKGQMNSYLGNTCLESISADESERSGNMGAGRAADPRQAPAGQAAAQG